MSMPSWKGVLDTDVPKGRTLGEDPPCFGYWTAECWGPAFLSSQPCTQYRSLWCSVRTAMGSRDREEPLHCYPRAERRSEQRGWAWPQEQSPNPNTGNSVQFSSVTLNKESCLTLCDPMTAACQASLSITNSWSPPKPMSIESGMPSNHLILCCPLLLTTGKTIVLTKWAFVDKVMSLLFNMLSRSVITFLLRSKCLFVSWLQSPSAGRASASSHARPAGRSVSNKTGLGAETGSLQAAQGELGADASPTSWALQRISAKLFVFFSFCLCHEACWVLVPQPGTEPGWRQWKLGVSVSGPWGTSLSKAVFKDTVRSERGSLL